MPDLHAQIAAMVTQMRESAGLSQIGLGKACGVSRWTITNYEAPTYRSHTVSFLVKIAQACHQDISTFAKPTVDTSPSPVKSPDDASESMERQ